MLVQGDRMTDLNILNWNMNEEKVAFQKDLGREVCRIAVALFCLK